VYQPWIPTDEQSGLLTPTAMMESVSLCVRMHRKSDRRREGKNSVVFRRR
jgi:hypothetical protein